MSAVTTLKCLDKIKSASNASLKLLDRVISSKIPLFGTKSASPILALASPEDIDKKTSSSE